MTAPYLRLFVHARRTVARDEMGLGRLSPGVLSKRLKLKPDAVARCETGRRLSAAETDALAAWVDVQGAAYRDCTATVRRARGALS